MSHSNTKSIVRHQGSVAEIPAAPTNPPISRWARFREIIWDGERSTEERRLVQKLDLHLMTWATYGYFVRLLDWSNIINAYVSGMKEDLNFHGNQYNLLLTFFTCGYVLAQVPSQLLLIKLRPSYYLPTAELLWTVVTFCFSAVQSVEQVLALRWIMGMLEAPFAVGVITVMGSYYTKRELAKRIAIFYSASYAASMFSGYLQVGIYKGLDGHLGLAGWRWLFIFCGVISLPGAFFGYYAIPDSPHMTKARWMTAAEREMHVARMEAHHRTAPMRLSWAKVGKVLRNWRIYVLSLTLICHCVATQPLNYFAVWLKSLQRFSLYQVNLFPTAAQALGLVTTLAYSWISDGLGGRRWQLMTIPAAINFVGMVIVAAYPNIGAVFFGYVINAASWGYWPLVYAWANEFCADDAEERAIIIGVSQSLGQAFIAWVPVVILNVGKYAPRFHLGFSILCGVSVLQFACIFLLRYFVGRDRHRERMTANLAQSLDSPKTGDAVGPLGAHGQDDRLRSYRSHGSKGAISVRQNSTSDVSEQSLGSGKK